MVSFLNILNIYSYILSHNNKATNLKVFFTYNFDIQISNPNLLNK